MSLLILVVLRQSKRARMEHKDILRSVSLTIWQLVQFAMLIANGRQEFSNPTHIYEVTEAWNMSMLTDLLLKCHCNEKIFDPILNTTEQHF